MDPKDEQDEEQQAFLSSEQTIEASPLRRKDKWRKSASYLRLAMECAMAVSLVALLIRPLSVSCRWSSKRTPVPSCGCAIRHLRCYMKLTTVLCCMVQFLKKHIPSSRINVI